MQYPPDQKTRETSDTTPLPLNLRIPSGSALRGEETHWEARRSRKPRSRFLSLAGFLLVVLAIATVTFASPSVRALFSSPLSNNGHTTPSGGAAGKIVGHIFFENSGQFQGYSSEGIADELQVSLTGISQPATGKSYYGWLIPDKSNPEFPSVSLGNLPVQNGSVNMLYQGNTLHSNLLQFAGGFIVTEGPTSSPPAFPPLDEHTWLYTAEFSQTPNPNDTVHHYTLLDHLRHLLAEDPTLASVGLHGGLGIWFYRETQEVYEWAISARDDQKPSALGLMRNLLISILDDLDGATIAKMELPEVSLRIDPQIAHIALLKDSPTETGPLSYLTHIDDHLHGVMASPGVTPEQQRLATQIDTNLQSVRKWLVQVHAETLQLIAMTNEQLLQSTSLDLLNDIVTKAQYAFIGQTDPATNTTQGGATQIQYNLLQLATLPVAIQRH